MDSGVVDLLEGDPATVDVGEAFVLDEVVERVVRRPKLSRRGKSDTDGLLEESVHTLWWEEDR